MNRILTIALVSAFAFSAAPSFASETPATVQKELKQLTKLAGAGEISNKEYNKRKQALLASSAAQQTAEATKK